LLRIKLQGTACNAGCSGFGLLKIRFKGLAKNTAQLVTLFALSNLWMARKQLMAMQGSVRPAAA
jgi:IS5 family transposase